MPRIKRVEDMVMIKAQKTGVYLGPGGDTRYYKAGDDVARSYQFSHEIGATVSQLKKA